MSLNQKYTWQDFLRDNPEHKEKGTKRTSSEGKKAFESAFKAKAKEYLDEFQKRCDRQTAKAKALRDERDAKVKELQKAKRFDRAKIAQRKLGRSDAALAQLARQKDAAKAKRKGL